MCQVLCCSSVPCHHIPSAYYVPGAVLFTSVLLSYTKRLLCARHCAVSPVPCHHISLPLLKQVILSSLCREGIYGLERLSNMAEELELMQTSYISSSLLLLPLASLCRYPGCVSWEFLLLCGKLYSPQEAGSSFLISAWSLLHAPPFFLFSLQPCFAVWSRSRCSGVSLSPFPPWSPRHDVRAAKATLLLLVTAALSSFHLAPVPAC